MKNLMPFIGILVAIGAISALAGCGQKASDNGSAGSAYTPDPNAASRAAQAQAAAQQSTQQSAQQAAAKQSAAQQTPPK